MTTDPRTIGRFIAVCIAAAAPVVMAAAQAVVIRDRVAIVHPLWPAWAVAAMAIGFELCILTTGLAIVVTGHKDQKLLAAEGFLIAMSVAVAVTAAFGLAPWVLSLTIALVPVQYACAFYAAHTLYVHWYAAPVKAQVKALARVSVIDKKTTTESSKPTAAPAGKLATDARVAAVLGLTPRGARDLRAKGDSRYGQALTTLSAHANGASAGAGASGAAGTGGAS